MIATADSIATNSSRNMQSAKTINIVSNLGCIQPIKTGSKGICKQATGLGDLSTIATDAMSSVMDSVLPGSSLDKGTTGPSKTLAGDSLLRLLADEVLASMAADADGIGSRCSSSVQGSNATPITSAVLASLDLEALTEIVLQAFQQCKKAERLPLKRCASDDPMGLSKDKSLTYRDISAPSDLVVPLDPFDPSFWTEVSDVSNSLHTDGSVAASADLGYTTLDRLAINSCNAPESAHTRQSLEALINDLNDASGDSESSDDLSQLSDITGLTDCFENKCQVTVNKVHQRSKSITLPCRANRSVSTGTRSVSSSLVGSLKRVEQENHDVRKLRSVSFHEVRVRQYERILCDFPASKNGPSIGLGWTYIQTRSKSVDHYEDNDRRRNQCRRKDFMLSRRARETLIREWGYSDRQIASVVRDLNRIRFQRRQTVNNLGVVSSKMEEIVETAKRRVKRCILRSKRGSALSTYLPAARRRDWRFRLGLQF
jgi:hypothetical protein